MKLSTCAIHIETAARARITQVQNAWHRLADYVAGLAILSFDEPEMEKLYVHEDSTEKISTDLFVHLFYSLATIHRLRAILSRESVVWYHLLPVYLYSVVQKVCGDLHAPGVVLYELLQPEILCATPRSD